jgi:hypothetical protein
MLRLKLGDAVAALTPAQLANEFKRATPSSASIAATIPAPSTKNRAGRRGKRPGRPRPGASWPHDRRGGSSARRVARQPVQVRLGPAGRRLLDTPNRISRYAPTKAWEPSSGVRSRAVGSRARGAKQRGDPSPTPSPTCSMTRRRKATAPRLARSNRLPVREASAWRELRSRGFAFS